MKIELYNDNFQNFKRYNINGTTPGMVDRKSTSIGFMIYWGLKLKEVL